MPSSVIQFQEPYSNVSLTTPGYYSSVAVVVQTNQLAIMAPPTSGCIHPEPNSNGGSTRVASR